MPLDKEVSDRLTELDGLISPVTAVAQKLHPGEKREENTKVIASETVSLEKEKEKIDYRVLHMDLVFSDSTMIGSKTNIDKVRELVKGLLPYSEEPSMDIYGISRHATIHNCRNGWDKPQPCDGEKDL